MKEFKLEIFDGGAIYLGRNIQTNLHTHYALEIAIAINKTFLFTTDGEYWSEMDMIVIHPHIAHQLKGNPDDLQLFIYFDPQSIQAQKISKDLFSARQGFKQLSRISFSIAITLLQDWIYEQEYKQKDILPFINQLTKEITPHQVYVHKADKRVTDSLLYVKTSLEADLSLEALSSRVGISSSRFAHLFKEHVGIPLRKYILWCRLQAAVESVMKGKSLTQAAYDGGFADSAHFTRTFQSMFGVSPSTVM